MIAYTFDGRRYDCGSKLGYLEATVDYGLKHPETGGGVRAVPHQPLGLGAGHDAVTLNELRYIVAVAQERSFGRAARQVLRDRSRRCRWRSRSSRRSSARRCSSAARARSPSRRSASASSSRRSACSRRPRASRRSRRPGATSSSARCGWASSTRWHRTCCRTSFPRCTQRAPQMPLEIEEDLTENLEVALKTGRIDAAIVALPFAPPGVVTDVLCTRSRSRSSCRRDHKWAKRKSVHPDELTGEHTILLNVGHCFRDQVLGQLPRAQPGRYARDAHELARDGAQHGGVGARHLGAAARCADAEVPQPARRAGAVREAGAVAPRRARRAQELSAARGDRGDARRGRGRSRAAGAARGGQLQPRSTRRSPNPARAHGDRSARRPD